MGIVQSITSSLLSVKTKSATNFFERWTAVISVLFVYLVLTLSMWSLLIDEARIAPSNSINSSRVTTPNNSKLLDNFYYFDGIGITDPSTNFANSVPPLSTTEIAEKCKMFGAKCLGFDTLGSLFLSRDRDIATLKGLQPQYKGGLYIAIENKHSEYAHKVCKKLGGNFNQTKRMCTQFNRGNIDNYPFPDNSIKNVNAFS